MDRSAREALWKAVEAFKDKLFFIAYQPPGASVLKWYLVQVDVNETDERKARQRSIYHAKWWAPHHVDCTSTCRAIVHCRFWPEIRELMHTGYLRARRVVRPHKVEAVVKQDERLAWFQLPLNLCQMCLHGPFEFTAAVNTDIMETHRVTDHDWALMEAEAHRQGINVEDICITPSNRKCQCRRAAVLTAAPGTHPKWVGPLIAPQKEVVATPWHLALKEKA